MADEDVQHPEKIRKTLTLTHRQAGVTGIAALVLYALQPTLAHFQTKDVADAKTEVIQAQLSALTQQNVDLKTAVHDVTENMRLNHEDTLASLRRLSDAQKLREQQQETRQKSTDDRQDRHIEMLEAKGLSSGRKTMNN